MAQSEQTTTDAAEPPRLVPLRLRDVDAGALAATAIYLRTARPDGSEEFHLYRAPDVPFTAAHYARLVDRGTETIYVLAPGADEPEIDAPQPQTFVDKRRHERCRLWCAARLLVNDDADKVRTREQRAIEAQVFDISRSGLGVLCAAELSLGSIVTVYLEVPGWGRRPLRTRVRRCRLHSAWCEAGLELF